MKTFLTLWLGFIITIASIQAQDCEGIIPPAHEKYRIYLTKSKPCKKRTIHKRVDFVTPKYVNNDYVTYFNLRYDFDDGLGFRDVSEDGTIHTINYTTIGKKTIRSRAMATYYDDEEGTEETLPFIRSFTIEIKAATGTYEEPDDVIDIDSGSGLFAYVKYAPGRQHLVKPLFLVTGLDFGLTQLQDANSSGANAQTIRVGSIGWDTAIMGTNEDILPENMEDTYRNYPSLFQTFLSQGYDIVFVDFKDGADFIENNVIALKELINTVNHDLKQPDSIGDMHENTIMGASMGGLIARITLAEMEKEDQSHCTGTFVSFDSPHKGANIALS